jgi:hypothetical protein
MPPPYAQMFLDLMRGPDLVTYWWDAMHCTARIAEGATSGFQVDVLRQPGTNHVKVLIEPWSRLESKLVPIDMALAVVVSLILLLNTSGPIRTSGYCIFSAVLVAMIPVFFIELAICRLFNRTAEAKLDDIASSVEAMLSRPAP